MSQYTAISVHEMSEDVMNSQCFIGTEELWQEVWNRLDAKLTDVASAMKMYVPNANIVKGYYEPSKNFTAYFEAANTDYGNAAEMAPNELSGFEFDYVLSEDRSTIEFTASLDKGMRYADLNEYRAVNLASLEDIQQTVLSVTALFETFVEQHTDLAVQLFLEPITSD